VDVARRHTAQGFVFEPRVEDHVGIDEAHGQILGQPVAHQLDQVVFRELRRAYHHDAHPVPINDPIQGIRLLARKQIGQALVRRRLDELGDEGGRFRASGPRMCLCVRTAHLDPF
jgi:hypothetical protein